MKIEILGTGCTKCKNLASNAEEAVAELGLSWEIVKVTDINEIAGRGVMMTPALVVDGAVKTMGRVATSTEIRRILEQLS